MDSQEYHTIYRDDSWLVVAGVVLDLGLPSLESSPGERGVLKHRRRRRWYDEG